MNNEEYQIEENGNDIGDFCTNEGCGGVMLLSYVSDVYGFNKVWTCNKCGDTESE